MSAPNANTDGTGIMNHLPSHSGIAGSATGTRPLKRRNALHHRAKLTAEQVRQMRSEYRAFVFGYEKLAEKFGCGISTARDIITYRTRINVR